jgi:hypothetical protein
MSKRGAATVLCCALLSAWLAEPTISAEKTPKSGALTETKEAPLAYISVAGAPGDGEQELSAALAKRLSAVGVKQVTVLAANVYSVEGIVKVMAAKGGRQAVRINWTIFGPDGATLGGVLQTKLVRKGSLDKKWGVAADAAARAAANEIAKLLPPRTP